MAQVKISNLTTWTGTPTDIKYFIMDNEGLNETYKVSGYTSLVEPGSGTGSIKSLNYTSANNSNDYGVLLGGTNNQMTSGQRGAIIGGYNNQSTTYKNDIFIGGGNGNSVNGDFSGVIAGFSNNNTSIKGFIGGGEGNTLSGTRNWTLGGFNTNNSANYGGLFGGENNNNTGDYNALLGGSSNNITGGLYMCILNGETNRITSGLFSNVLGGASNTHTSGDYSSIVAGSSNTMTGSYSAIIAGDSNSNSATRGVIAGGQNNILGGANSFTTGQNNNVSGSITAAVGYNNTISGSITAGIGDGNLIDGGYASQVVGFRNQYRGGNDNGSFIAGSQNKTTINGAVGTFNIGGSSNRLQNFRSVSDAGREVYGGILGGYDNYIGSSRSNPDTSNQGQNAYPLILGGTNNTIIGVADGAGDPNYYPTIINGEGSTISGDTTGSTIINSFNSVISNSDRISIIGSVDSNVIASAETSSIISSVDTDITGNTHERVVMLGTSGRTDLFSETTHVENIHTFKTETFTEYNGGSVAGTIDVDCSVSSFFLFTLSGDCSPNFINVRDGQRFFFIVYNNGSWAVPTATLNGAAGKVMAKNGSISPGNNSYSKYVATYDSVNDLLFLDEETGFSAV